MKVGGFFGDLGGTRTHGPLIKSCLLYTSDAADD